MFGTRLQAARRLGLQKSEFQVRVPYVEGWWWIFSDTISGLTGLRQACTSSFRSLTLYLCSIGNNTTFVPLAMVIPLLWTTRSSSIFTFTTGRTRFFNLIKLELESTRKAEGLVHVSCFVHGKLPLEAGRRGTHCHWFGFKWINWPSLTILHSGNAEQGLHPFLLHLSSSTPAS